MKHSLIFGRRRQGKTTLGLHLAMAGSGGVAIYDINSQIERFPKNTTSDLGLFANWLDASDERVLVYRPQRDVWGEFDGFAEILWHKRGFTLFIDEASQLQSASGAHPWLDRFVRMCSARDVQIIQTLHRPRDAATLCRSLATDWYVFRTTLESDLDVISEHCGGSLSEQVGRFAEGNHHALHWDDALGQADILSSPDQWFEPLR